MLCVFPFPGCQNYGHTDLNFLSCAGAEERRRQGESVHCPLCRTEWQDFPGVPGGKE